MAKSQTQKTTKEDWPLLLRLSFEESKGGPHTAPVHPLDARMEGVGPHDEVSTRTGTYQLRLSDKRGFPPRHEFSLDWLLEQNGRGFVTVTPDTIVLELTNGRAVYEIDRARMEDADGLKLSTGYWGVLKESEIY